MKYKSEKEQKYILAHQKLFLEPQTMRCFSLSPPTVSILLLVTSAGKQLFFFSMDGTPNWFLCDFLFVIVMELFVSPVIIQLCNTIMIAVAAECDLGKW